MSWRQASQGVLAAYSWSDILYLPTAPGSPTTKRKPWSASITKGSTASSPYNARRAEEELLGGAVTGAKQKGKGGPAKGKRGAKKGEGEQLGLRSEHGLDGTLRGMTKYN